MLHVKLNIQRFAVSASVSYSVQSQDPATNTSVVRITFTVKRTSGSTYWSDGKTLTFSCDGQTGSTSFSFPSGSVGYSKSASYDFTVTHNNDGTKYIEFGARIVTGTSAGTLNPTGNANLPTIPRYTTTTNWSIASKTETSITLNWSTANNCSQIRYGTSTSTYNTINVSGNSGQVTISGLTANTPYSLYFMPKRSDSGLWGNGSANTWSSLTNQYTYDYPKTSTLKDIKLKLDEDFTIGFYNPLQKTFDFDLISNVDSSIIYSASNVSGTSYTIPMADVIDDLYETIPDTTEATYYIKVTTNGNIRNSENKKYTIDPDTCRPIMSVVGYEDINTTTLALTNDDQTLVMGYSTIQVTVADGNKATPRYSASIAGYKIKNGDYVSPSVIPEVEGEDVILTCLATSGIIEVYAVDSRGQSGLYQIVNTTIINYTPLTKNQNPVAERTDDQGHPNGVGEYVKITLGGTYWNSSFGNTTNSIKSISYEYINARNPGQPTPGTTQVTATATNNLYNISQLILGDTQHGFNIDNSYIINVTVNDELSSATFTMTLGSGTPHISYSPNGVSIMGKYNEQVGGLFQVGGQPFTGGDTLPINSTFEYDGSIVPEGYEEVADYSTSEINTNKLWIDDKPIYRKVTSLNLPSSFSGWTYLFSLSNVSTIINIYGNLTKSDGQYPIPRYESANYYLQFRYQNNGQIEALCAGFANQSIKLIVEYTKTTD